MSVVAGILFGTYRHYQNSQKSEVQDVTKNDSNDKNHIGVPSDLARHIESKSNLIKVHSPVPMSSVRSPLLITGEARGMWYFEASFPLTLVDWDGRIIAESFATAQDEWMTEEFVSFEFENPSFPGVDEDHFSRRGTLIFQKDNPSGLPEHDNALEIPVWFE